MHEPPQEIFARCPTIVAVNEDHWMVHCTDNIVRRAVPDRITGNYFLGSDGHAYWTDMFAAPGHACHPPVTGTQLASYEYYQSDKKLAYHVNSEPEPSLIAESPLYPLAPGTFMVVPRFGKCHIIAAVQALLAEGKSRWAAAAQLRACKWDTTIASAFTLRSHLSGLAGAEHRHLKFCAGMDRYWVRTGIFLVRDLMEEVGGPCLFLYCGQAIIIDEISRHASTTNLTKKNWLIRLRLFRSCSWMEVSHPADILTAARELTPLRPPPQQPRFQTFAKPMFNQEQWAAFCIGTPGKTPMERQGDLIKNSYS